MSRVIDHIGLKVADIERSREFYREVLATLGLDLLADFAVGREHHVGFGRGRPSFWISSGKVTRGDAHVAFIAASRAEVEAFHAVALSLGGRDNGAPGIRAQYHPNYFGAFVYDADGHNIEAVYHGAE
jgi:catechol 2,3-dioxygenase-like lactoylglutathione lyase family enzyme